MSATVFRGDKALVAQAALAPLDQWGQKCHQASLALVKAGVLGTSRVARGSCRGVGGQHSWVVLGNDCYDPNATIVDPTLWSYDRTVEGVWVGSMRDRRHQPHGYYGGQTIWEWGKPAPATGPVITLTPAAPLSPAAQHFLALLGPLDWQGWAMLVSNAPVLGWPAGEIIAAASDTPGLGAAVPIDRLGMLTDRNPSGLYLP